MLNPLLFYIELFYSLYSI